MRRLPSRSGQWLALALVAAAGCSDGDPPTAHLRGSVTIDGQPIPLAAEAHITFRATAVGQANSASARIVDGRFDVRDAPQGPVRVDFIIQLPIGEAPFAPGAPPEMQYRSLVPDEHAGGMAIKVVGDDLNMKLDL
jgi:hypothetical protein